MGFRFAYGSEHRRSDSSRLHDGDRAHCRTGDISRIAGAAHQTGSRQGRVSSARQRFAQPPATESGPAGTDTVILNAKRDTIELWLDNLDLSSEIKAFSTNEGRAYCRNFLNSITSDIPASDTVIDAEIAQMVTLVGVQTIGVSVSEMILG